MAQIETTKSRFSDAPWMKFREYITIIGAGGIGSWTAFILAKMGYNITVYDNDVLETVNIGSQLYPLQFCNKTKVNAMEEMFNFFDRNYYGYDAIADRFTEDHAADYYMICAVDNMATRKLSVEKWFKYNEENGWVNNPIYIDGRMDAESIEIYCLTCAEDFHKYQHSLFNDEEVSDAPCSFKSTPYTAALIGSRITSILINHICNFMDNNTIRTVPFYIQEIIPLFYTKVV